MVMCWAPGCTHYNVRETCRFFRFPKEPALRKKWIARVRRVGEPGSGAFLCSCHFVDGKKESGPEIFAYNQDKRFTFPSPERNEQQSRKPKIENISLASRFPKDKEKRKIWLDAIDRKNWEPTEHSRLCSAHFEDRYKTRTLKSPNSLSADAVPTIFAPEEEVVDPIKQEVTSGSDNDTRQPQIQVLQVPYKPVPRELTIMEARIDNMTQRCAAQNKKIKLLEMQTRREERKITNMKRVLMKLQGKPKAKEDPEDQVHVLVVYD